MHGPETLPYRSTRTLPRKPKRDEIEGYSGSKIYQPTPSREAGPEFGPAPRSSGGAPGHRAGGRRDDQTTPGISVRRKTPAASPGHDDMIYCVTAVRALEAALGVGARIQRRAPARPQISGDFLIMIGAHCRRSTASQISWRGTTPLCHVFPF